MHGPRMQVHMVDSAVDVKISKVIYDEIDRRIKSKDLEFESVDAFIEFALSDVLDITPSKELSKDDDEVVSKRLSSFGY